jgi:hypothetical protein
MFGCSKQFGYSVTLRSDIPNTKKISVQYGNYKRSTGNLNPGYGKTEVGVYEPVPEMAVVVWTVEGQHQRSFEVVVRSVAPDEFFKNGGSIIFTVKKDSSVVVSFYVNTGQYTRKEVPAKKLN